MSCPECDDLREQVRRLEEALMAPRAGIPREWRLTPQEERLFCAIVRSPLLTREQGVSAMHFDHLGEDFSDKMVDVFICKIRQKLPAGIVIHTSWGRGYFLDEATRARFGPVVGRTMMTPRPEYGRLGTT